MIVKFIHEIEIRARVPNDYAGDAQHLAALAVLQLLDGSQYGRVMILDAKEHFIRPQGTEND